MSAPKILFSEEEIAARVQFFARRIASLRSPPQLLAGILVGAFVFTADLARALAREGLSLPVEFLWLRSYGEGRSGSEVQVLAGANESARGRHVLLIDGVLDRGTTLAKAKALLIEQGAASVASIVAVDKQRPDALLKADFALFEGVSDFIVGYGMDDGGAGRGLPHIASVNAAR